MANYTKPLREVSRLERNRLLAYQKKLNELKRASASLDKEGVRRLTSLISDTRKAILLDIASAAGWEAQYLPEMRRAFEATVAELNIKYKDLMKETGRRGFDLGNKLIDLPLESASIFKIFPEIDPRILEIAQGFSADLIDGISADLLRRINSQVTLGVLQGRRPFDVMKEIGKNLKDPSTFKTVFDRAEAITRTETARIQELARASRMEQVKEILPEMKSQWIVGDRPCEECEPYADQIFEIGEEPELPVHPNCLCRLIPYVEDITEII